MSSIKVIACSGIGKAMGLMARETALQVTGKLSPDTTETVCLAHVVTGDEDARNKVEGHNCITVDGCPAMCAAKSVEHAGGIVKAKYRVIDEMRNHKGVDAGTGTALTKDGWKIVDELAGKISKKAAEITREGQSNG